MPEEIYRTEDDKIVAGVCGGLAEHYDLDPNLVRIAALLVILLTFPIGLFAYLFAWWLLPPKSEAA